MTNVFLTQIFRDKARKQLWGKWLQGDINKQLTIISVIKQWKNSDLFGIYTKEGIVSCVCKSSLKYGVIMDSAFFQRHVFNLSLYNKNKLELCEFKTLQK